jgi:hypothetical protein
MLQLFRLQANDPPKSCSSAGKSAAITGKLGFRLMGCQDLLEDVPGRSRRDSTHSAPNDPKSFVKGTSFCFVLKRYPFLCELSIVTWQFLLRNITRKVCNKITKRDREKGVGNVHLKVI